jgi:CheY-like chemotaxis protein
MNLGFPPTRTALPQDAAPLERDAASSASAQACNAGTRGRYAVLVVDDSEAVRYATTRALKQAGFHTVEASGGAQALQLAPYVSAMVLDIHLPDVNGMEVCRLARTSEGASRLGIVHASSVYRDAIHEATSRAAGADAFLVMPVDPSVLVAAVEAAINTRAAA